MAVDDNLVALKSLEEHLAKLTEWEVSLSSFRDWASARQKLDTGYDLVFLDYYLEGETGRDICSEIRESGNNCPIIVFSGSGDEYLVAEIMRAGADDYLSKSQLNEQNLSSSIRHVLERKAMEARIREYQQNLETMVSERTDELEQALNGLKNAHMQLVQSEKMASIGQIAAGVAHEINNPLSFISSNLNSLNRYIDKLTAYIGVQDRALAGDEHFQSQRKRFNIEFITADIRDLIQESLEGADRVKMIVADLKSFSRVDRGEQELADLNQCLESTLNIVWNELKYNAEVVKDLGDISATRCYPQQLNQVFMNLLVNASHAIGDKGRIAIRTWQEAGSNYVSISDTGCGIAKEHMQSIFEPFFTTKEVGKGTGLGLSISYDIVKKHQGDIVVDSEVGKGTTFTVRVPIRDEVQTAN